MATATTNILTVVLSQFLTHAQDHWNKKYSDEEVAKYEKYKGRVLKVVDEEREARFSDYSEYYPARRVTVWDEEQGKPLTFDALVIKNQFALWGVDADYETVAAYREWVRLVGGPATAKAHAEDARQRVLNRGNEEVAKILTPSLQRGQVLTVYKGRKFPIGAKGRVFWWGDNRWGMTVGLATTERKDAKGKNLDVIFVALDNLKYEPTDADKAKVQEITTNYADWAAKTEEETYAEVYERFLNNETI